MHNTARLGRRLTLHFALIQICFNMAYCGVLSFAAVYLLARGFTNSQVGLTLTAASVLSMLVQSRAGALIDKVPRATARRVTMAVLGLMVVSFAALMVVPAVVPLVAALYVLMAGLAMTEFSLLTTLAMEPVARGIPLNYSLARGFGALMYSGMSFLLGALTQRFGPVVVVPVAMGITAVQLVLVYLYRWQALLPAGTAAGAPPANGAQDAAGNATSPAGEIPAVTGGFFAFLGRYRLFTLALVALVLCVFSHSLINTYMVQIIRHLGGTDADLGVAGGIGALVELPAALVFTQVLKRWPNAGLWLRVAGVAFAAKSLFTLLAPGLGWLYAAQTLQFFGFGLYMPASVYYTSQAIPPADMAKGQAAMAMTMTVANIAGNVSGGFLLDGLGVTAMLGVGTAVGAAGAVLLLVALRRRGPKQAG